MSAKIIWFTGLSGVGKTSLSKFFYKKNFKKIKIKKIDGDIFRKKNKVKNKFTKKNIIKNNNNIIKYILSIKNSYDMVLVSVISPLRITRLKAKKIFKKNYYEVFVNCALKTLKKRDTKSLYRKADLGKVKLIGYNSKILYEKSNYNVININTDNTNLKNFYKKIINKINL